ncbi:uncharacterized protein B0P05DRAFT_523852 [Gilbertella persicaria]|uniref:uncharacterized protein n=1 Tax=Gilbertella persicaria TaxID=101096 RepID=UPI002220AD63|nr:uncharacterized protein B0P05DRAFT_523852 [Gilbertella persicaria]KAI8094895.1 hypothetical protein B0P05DRAFT_523852 [Gilbertella persicaria]
MIVQKLNYHPYQKWLPVLILRMMGYSSLATAILGMIVYWYKKNSLTKYRAQQKKLSVSTDIKRSISTFSNLSFVEQHDYKRRQLITPPTSPHSMHTNELSPRVTSPLGFWSSRLIDNVISNMRKKKKLTLSLKNTILWNPSRDINRPNHAFHENTLSLLSRLSQLYDIYILIQINSAEEQDQIQQLLHNVNLFDGPSLDKRKILYCNSEEGKLHLIKHIQPHTHIEGGDEFANGHHIVQKLVEIERIIWVLSSSLMQRYQQNDQLELTDHILCSSIAEQVSF